MGLISKSLLWVFFKSLLWGFWKDFHKNFMYKLLFTELKKRNIKYNQKLVVNIRKWSVRVYDDIYKLVVNIRECPSV